MTRVWLPDVPGKFGPLPPGIEADVWSGGDELPGSADEVEYVVLPFGVRPEMIRKVGALPRLKTLQILSAGADHILPHVPAHITLCNARGAHTPATAELTAGLIVASLRNFPRFAVAQHEGRWAPTLSDPVAGKRVLIVGYGDIGAAVERRLAGWEVAVDRVARRARDGVRGIGDLPELLPIADIVVILVPVTAETRH
ncbi:MAG: NAD(P)-dependent oxidoreductase, partial [Trebonia sp.]